MDEIGDIYKITGLFAVAEDGGGSAVFDDAEEFGDYG
jgi:hypothetical protein